MHFWGGAHPCRGRTFWLGHHALVRTPQPCFLSKPSKLIGSPSWIPMDSYFGLSLVSYEEGTGVCRHLPSERSHNGTDQGIDTLDDLEFRGVER